MTNVDRFRKQHEKLLKIVREMDNDLDAQKLKQKENVKAISTSLARLAGSLKTHLAMEDDRLYPKLIEHDDPEISNTAKQFQKEMGGIKEAFTKYADKWNSLTIRNATEDFIQETQDIFAVLGDRITKEENELYPLLK